MLEVSTLRSPPTPSRPSGSSCCKAADQHQQLGFVGDHAGFPAPSTTDVHCCCDDHDFVSMVEVDHHTDSLQLLDYIDFSSCDVVVPFFDADGDVLPDLEADPTELLAEFSLSTDDDDPTPPTVAGLGNGGDEAEAEAKPDPDVVVVDSSTKQDDDDDDPLLLDDQPMPMVVVEADKKAADEIEKRWLVEAAADGEKSRDDKGIKDNGEEEGGGSSAVTTSITAQDQEDAANKPSSAEGGHHHHSHGKKKPSAAAGNNSHGKRKVKVDWTPELHRRFVQAVEQLGIDKAVPSRILEIMGIQCLTRHNIASHLQKYRSHRKHLMAREAEAASWAQKRHPRKLVDVPPSAAAAAAPRPWVLPTIGFPPPAPFCRPLHVWGHPPATTAGLEAAAASPTTMVLPVWPRHLAPPPRPTWAHPPPVDLAYWHQQYSVRCAPTTPTPVLPPAARKWGPHPPAAAGTPCVPPVPRFPIPVLYRPATTTTMVPPPPPQSSSKLAELQLQLDAHPSKESIDAAIGDVLVKPWLPLPLGLKPPSLDSVMSELHKQGIPKVPPAATNN